MAVGRADLQDPQRCGGCVPHEPGIDQRSFRKAFAGDQSRRYGDRKEDAGHLHIPRRGDGLFAEEADDIDVERSREHRLLLFLQRLDGLEAIARASRVLEIELGRRLLHLGLELAHELVKHTDSIGVVSEVFAMNAPSDTVVIPFDGSFPAWQIQLLYQASAKTSRRVLALAHFAKERLDDKIQ